ncbi:hypothetical protein LCGC14_2078700 [marine sediment metagenome]|uniref:Uncharacterized protein n=1 Tax=marine sediment metagenome TaxID=412755 RepID=A0A0F9GUM0_9ZZZZ
MARRYAITGNEGAVSTSLQAALDLEGTAVVRPMVYDFMVGQDGTPPADNAILWTIERFTVTPTDTAVVPVAMEPGDVAATAVAGEDGGTTGTITTATEFLELPINQRASYRWVAAPGGEIICPAIVANGVTARVSSPAYTGTAKASIHYSE